MYMKYADKYAYRVAPLCWASARQGSKVTQQKIIVERINIRAWSSSDSKKHCAVKICGARIKGTQEICMNAAMANGRCYSHGVATPAKHPNYKPNMNALKHGMRSKKMIEIENMLKQDLKSMDTLYNAMLQGKAIRPAVAELLMA